jgi:hypothetical protein
MYQSDEWMVPWDEALEASRDSYRKQAHPGLSAAFSWRDDKLCEVCDGTGIAARVMGAVYACPNASCTSGRVEGDRRVILAQRVGRFVGKRGAYPQVVLDYTTAAANAAQSSVPVFVATPVQSDQREDSI